MPVDCNIQLAHCTKYSALPCSLKKQSGVGLEMGCVCVGGGGGGEVTGEIKEGLFVHPSSKLWHRLLPSVFLEAERAWNMSSTNHSCRSSHLDLDTRTWTATTTAATTKTNQTKQQNENKKEREREREREREQRSLCVYVVNWAMLQDFREFSAFWNTGIQNFRLVC